MDINGTDIIKIVGTVLLWGVAIIIGLCIFATVSEFIIDLSQTSIGTIILIVAGIVLYRKYKENH